MAATSIKVQADTKRALDQLQAELTQEVGRKVTLQELTEALARLGTQQKDRLLAAFVDRPRKVSAAQLRRLRKLQFDAGFPPQGDWDLDDLIYGFPHGPDEPVTPGARRFYDAMQRQARRRRTPARTSRRLRKGR